VVLDHERACCSDVRDRQKRCWILLFCRLQVWAGTCFRTYPSIIRVAVVIRASLHFSMSICFQKMLSMLAEDS